jgi:hypothetical protein
MLNGVPFTQSHEHYNYRAYLETLELRLKCISINLTTSYWYLDNGDMQPCDPMAETHTSATNDGFIDR